MIILGFFLYLLIGFITVSLVHLYFQETQDYEFFIFVFIWPLLLSFLSIFLISKIFKPYLDFLGKLK